MNINIKKRLEKIYHELYAILDYMNQTGRVNGDKEYYELKKKLEDCIQAFYDKR
jgi:hypothetical protein